MKAVEKIIPECGICDSCCRKIESFEPFYHTENGDCYCEECMEADSDNWEIVSEEMEG